MLCTVVLVDQVREEPDDGNGCYDAPPGPGVKGSQNILVDTFSISSTWSGQFMRALARRHSIMLTFLKCFYPNNSTFEK